MTPFVDVLCIGHASYDLVFSVDRHPGGDEKTVAGSFLACGGGPAANAAVTVARLGYKSAFAGYLGDDLYGGKHLQEFLAEDVGVDYVVRGMSPTPLSVILVKPSGNRTVVNYRGDTASLSRPSDQLRQCRPKVILVDGHEPHLSDSLVRLAGTQGVITVLDAGSVHPGTRKLVSQVDHVVASKKFALDFTGKSSPEKALDKLRAYAPSVIITLGQEGLIWKNTTGSGRFGAFPVRAVDTTGAGDAFHGAFAAGLAAEKKWPDLLAYAAAAGALCCTGVGARPAIPTAQAVARLLAEIGRT